MRRSVATGMEDQSELPTFSLVQVSVPAHSKGTRRKASFRAWMLPPRVPDRPWTQPAPSMSPLIRWVLPAGIAALAIALIGGYAFRWSWTGITPNDQMWDLLHVIVLPVVLATLPIWYRTRRRWRMEWHVVFAGLAAVFGVLVFGGYALDWAWTGFQGNTLWDWLELLALPFVVASLPLWFATHRRFEGRGVSSV